MQIACTTTSAATEVVALLLGAHLRSGREFRLTGLYPPGTPIYVTLSKAISAHLVAQIRAIPDTTIVEEDTI